MELYQKRGFEQTTVAEIAKRAGLTERTFFRHFADKREVLFAGSTNLQDLMVRTVRSAPDSAPPIERSPQRSRPPAPCSRRTGTTPVGARRSSLRTRTFASGS